MCVCEGAVWLVSEKEILVLDLSLETSKQMELDSAIHSPLILTVDGKVWIFSSHLILVFDSATFQLLKSLKIPLKPTAVKCLAGEMWVSCSALNEIQVFDKTTFAKISAIPNPHPKGIVDFVCSGENILSYSADGSLFIWNQKVFFLRFPLAIYFAFFSLLTKFHSQNPNRNW